MPPFKSVALVGAGKLGEAFISGLLRSGRYKANQIMACEIVASRRDYITQHYGVSCSEDLATAIKASDVVILAVKPKEAPAVLAQLEKTLTPTQVIISPVAGMPIAFIAKFLGASTRHIFRVMPNLACHVCEGVVALSPAPGTPSEVLKEVRVFLSALGRVVEVEEALLNGATGLIGSGPAYAYLVIEAMADAGVKIGFSREDAVAIAAQVFLGSARLILETGEHPAKLRDRIVTPAGTTIEGMLELERRGVRGIIADAVFKAARRAEELSASLIPKEK